MSCEQCCIDMIPVSASDFFDDSGYIGFTAWTCLGCGCRMEEIENYPAGGDGEPRKIRYPVAA